MSNNRYVQFGAGFSDGAGWENFDNSPSLRLTRLPIVGSVFTRLGAVRFPSSIRYGDVLKGPLSPENSCSGVYASHVLEHLSLADIDVALRNTLFMLKPGGIFRLIVPDLAGRAKIYLDKVAQKAPDASHFFMKSAHLGKKSRPRGAVQLMRSWIGNSEHLWMWDEPTLTKKLQDLGFVAIRRCRFGDCEDKTFATVESLGRFREEEIDIDELAIECRKPSAR